MKVKSSYCLQLLVSFYADGNVLDLYDDGGCTTL